jgi:hypothetical protein
MKRFVDYFAWLEEEYRIKKLQFLVDQTCYLLVHRLLTYNEAVIKIAWVRKEAQKLFPNQMQTYDLIYQTRLDRLLAENYTEAGR